MWDPGNRYLRGVQYEIRKAVFDYFSGYIFGRDMQRTDSAADPGRDLWSDFVVPGADDGCGQAVAGKVSCGFSHRDHAHYVHSGCRRSFGHMGCIDAGMR